MVEGLTSDYILGKIVGTRKKYTNDELNGIYDRTSGRCHVCHKKIAFKNYGVHGARGSWHVDHSKPLAKGGTSHKANLFPACIPCNLSKSTFSARTARGWVGKAKAPLSRDASVAVKKSNTVGASLIGAGLGAAVGGPPGALFGAIVGAFVGNSQAVDG